MRKYDVAYVPNGPVHYFPAVPLQDMSLEEIKKKYIKMCGKANGDISVCSRCATPCAEGRRAIQLIANEVCDTKVPLYGGKTLIEKAREQNAERRRKMEEEKKPEIKPEKKKRTVSARYEGWWDESIESGDQVRWLMEKYGLTRTQAKKKVYQYRYNHGLTNVREKVTEVVTPAAEVVIEKEEPKTDGIEAKLELLLKKQETHKKAMDKYMELYNKEKEEYDKIKQKTDILCSALDIVNE